MVVSMDCVHLLISKFSLLNHYKIEINCCILKQSKINYAGHCHYHDHVSTEPHILSPFLTTPVTSLETFRHHSGSLVIFKNLSNCKY